MTEKHKQVVAEKIANSETLYIFIDESGNFDFSPSGTKYFVLTAFATFSPVEERDMLLRLKYDLLSSGINQEYFHATEDKQIIRDKVYAFLEDMQSKYEIHSVIARKNKTNPSLYDEQFFYELICKTLLRYIFQGKLRRVDNIVVVLGSLFTRRKQEAILNTLHNFLKFNFSSIHSQIYFHQSGNDLNCQLADYCCWAISVKYTRNEQRPYQIIKKRIKSEFNIFKTGDTIYY